MNPLLLSAVLIYAVGLVLYLPSIRRAIKHTRGSEFLACAAWTAMFVGQGQIFRHSGGFSLFSAGVWYQLSWMLMAALLVVIVLTRVRISTRMIPLPLLALFLYAITGLVSALVSPAPFLSAYKASQVLLDAILALSLIAILVKTGSVAKLVALTYFLVTLVVASAALGGVIFPDAAYLHIYGAARPVLHGEIIKLHHNELGLMAGIVVVVSLRRFFARNTLAQRIYWVSSLWLGLVVLYNTTARTSIAAVFLAMLFMTILIRQLRPLGLVLALGGMALVSYMLVTGSWDISLQGTALEAYLRRGASDEQIRSLSGRIPLWLAGLEMFKDSPIVGHGFEAGARFGGVPFGIPLGANMHSAPMEVLVNTGLAGLLSWLLFVIPVGWGITRLLLRRPKRLEMDEWGLRVESFLVLFLLLFRAMAGHVLVSHQFNMMIFISLMLFMTEKRRTSQSARESGAVRVSRSMFASDTRSSAAPGKMVGT